MNSSIETETTEQKKGYNIATGIYIVVFILIIILLIITTYKLYLTKSFLNCEYSPEVYCSNEWTCATFGDSTVNDGVNSCFKNSAYAWNTANWKDDGSTNNQEGLPECLFGINSDIATEGSGILNQTDALLTCNFGQDTLIQYNCSKGCELSLADVGACTGNITT